MRCDAQWVAALALCAIQHATAAEPWPTKPLKVIVPFTVGSSTDIVARTVSERLALALGYAIIVENRPGAGGTIGAAAVAKAEADGHTILVHSSSHTVTPSTYPTQPFDTVRDFAGITPLGFIPNVLVVAPSKGVRSVGDLVNAAKAKPGAMNFASAGAGSATQLNGERFRLGAGIEAVHIPFKGTPEALTEVITGRVDYYFCPVVSALPHLQSGRLLALAVGSSKRSSVLPAVPTTIEAGVPNSDYNFWVGMFVPRKTSSAVIEKLHRETVAVLESTAVRALLAKLGVEPMILSPGEFDAYIRDEIVANAALVKAAGIKVN